VALNKILYTNYYNYNCFTAPGLCLGLKFYIQTYIRTIHVAAKNDCTSGDSRVSRLSQ